MKKTNITRFAKTAVQVYKNGRGKYPIRYSCKDGKYTVACNYFLIRTESEELYNAILSKIPESNRAPEHLVYDIQTEGLQPLTDTGIIHESKYSFRRFLMAEDFMVTVNEDFRYIFDGDYVSFYSAGSNSPVVVYGYDYTAIILPLRHRSNEASLATMHQLIERSGWQPDREEV